MFEYGVKSKPTLQELVSLLISATVNRIMTDSITKGMALKNLVLTQAHNMAIVPRLTPATLAGQTNPAQFKTKGLIARPQRVKSLLLQSLIATMIYGTIGSNLVWARQTGATIIKNKPTSPKVLTENQPPLPNVALSKDILYKLTTSELAVQRGEWQSAFVTVLSVAQQTRDPRLAKRAMEIAMGAQQMDESMAALRLWRELAPGSGEAEQYYLSLMVVQNNFTEIQKLFAEKLRTSDLNEQIALIHHAQRVLARMQDNKQAFNTLETILRPFAETFDARIALSRGAFRNKDSVRALAEARAATQLRPDSELAVLTLAQASEPQDALKLVADYLKRLPQAKEVRLAYATMLIENKQLAAAKQEFLFLLREQESKGDSTTQSLYTLGAIEMDLAQIDEAEKYFTLFLQRVTEEDDASPVYVNLAQIALQRKDKKTADLWLAKVERKDGKNPAWFTIQMRRALLIASDGKYPDARKFLQTVSPENDAERIQLLQTEAQIMKDAGQTLEAFVLLQLALSEYPDSSELLYDFAMLAEMQKQYPEMEGALKQLIQMMPNNALAYNALGYSYADRNIELQSAQKLIEAANQLSPNDPYILDSLGWVKFRLNKLPEAEQFLRSSFALRQDVDVTVHLAEVLWAQDKKTEAIQLFNDARKKDNNNALLRSTLERLGLVLP